MRVCLHVRQSHLPHKGRCVPVQAGVGAQFGPGWRGIPGWTGGAQLDEWRNRRGGRLYLSTWTGREKSFQEVWSDWKTKTHLGTDDATSGSCSCSKMRLWICCTRRTLISAADNILVSVNPTILLLRNKPEIKTLTLSPLYTGEGEKKTFAAFAVNWCYANKVWFDVSEDGTCWSWWQAHSLFWLPDLPDHPSFHPRLTFSRKPDHEMNTNVVLRQLD